MPLFVVRDGMGKGRPWSSRCRCGGTVLVLYSGSCYEESSPAYDLTMRQLISLFGVSKSVTTGEAQGVSVVDAHTKDPRRASPSRFGDLLGADDGEEVEGVGAVGADCGGEPEEPLPAVFAE